MTPKQIERIQKRIKNIRAELAAERQKFGWYDDSKGLRYLPPELFIKIEDYKGGQTYLRWFDKNFPDDIGAPDFLFNWTIILFKNNKLKDAEKKAFKTFYSNTYLFDKFFDKEITPVEKYESSNWESPEYAEYLTISANQENLNDFTDWLRNFLESEKFQKFKEKYIETATKLKTVEDKEERHYLLQHLWKLENEIIK